jgi:hypothetical protein
LGAVTTGVLLAMEAKNELAQLAAAQTRGAILVMYGLKLLIMELALLAPYLVLALLGGALMRETTRWSYRAVGLVISVTASAGVVGMLLAGMVPVALEEAMDAVIGDVVPALLLLSVCALLYGGLVWLAQHGRLESFMPGAGEPASPSPHD